jgi:site-specific DNA recombinase
MLGYISKRRVPVVLCEKIDRLTRNLKDAAIISDWIAADSNREIHFVKELFVVNKNTRAHENLVWDMKVAIARFYSNNLSEEVKKGHREKLAQGWIPTKPRLGYKTVGEKGHKIHVIDPDVAPYIVKMFEWYGTGNYSLSRLQSELHKAGLRTENGKMICTSRLHRLLREPFYYGKIRWSGGIHEGRHEPLISRDLFNKAQRVLKRQMENPHYRKHSPLFKAKIHCQHCGGILTWETQKGHWYGHCNNHGQFRRCAKKTYIREERVEDQLSGYFVRIAPANEEVLSWIEELIQAEEAGKVKEREKEAGRLTTLLQQVRRRLDKLYEDKIDELISIDFYQRKFAEYSAEEQSLKEALIVSNDPSNQNQRVGVAIHRLGYTAMEIYERALPDEKRLLLSEIFTNLIQDAYKITPNYTLAGKYLADWVPKLNKDYEPQKNVTPQGKRKDLVLSSPSWREWRDSLRTFDWFDLFPDPMASLAEINQLLGIASAITGLISQV